MNELIKQFVVQAGFSETYGLKEKERLSKFAELIVWECAMVASTETSDDGVGEVIKEHFGIKE
jgi:hypothetical protein